MTYFNTFNYKAQKKSDTIVDIRPEIVTDKVDCKNNVNSD